MQPRRHSRILGLLIAGAAAIVPATAQAATVSETPGILTYATAPGEANHVTIVRWGSTLRVTETGTQAGKPIALAARSGCTKLSASSAACSATVSALIADLGDGDDFFDASGTAIGASVMCGAGDDASVTTGLDSVATDCELRPPSAPVDEPAPEDAPPPDPQPAPAPDRAAPVQVVEVSLSGIARVLVTCPADSGGCTGTVAIQLPTAGVTAARRSSTTIGQARFTAKAGSTPTVPVQLSKRGRQRIVRGRSRRGRIRIATEAADGATVVTIEDVAFSIGAKAKRGRGRR
jgi:hypothetical protein